MSLILNEHGQVDRTRSLEDLDRRVSELEASLNTSADEKKPEKKGK